ncbi:MAG: hypothetical protein KJO77_03195 [Bacteroidia bacterium]|nr:hypothetical protein [Bacteroidia bacterium]NND52534.1 hypothetical protein [Flavobacteriaceae bacterium]
MKYLIVFALILLTQCESDNQVICTEQFVYGLNVIVKDAETAEIITDNISVVARDGNYEEELMNIEGFDAFIGAGERPGDYIIEVSSTAYQMFTSELIQVDADECHVIPQVVDIELIPN